MADNKYLWRANVRGVSKPIYLVAQNMQSAHAAAASPPHVAPEDVLRMQRIDTWDAPNNMTLVHWPEAPPEPEP